MPASKSDFVELCVRNDVLRFGSFTLKSGRVSPYFFNAGLFDHGRLLAQLAEQYAALIQSTIDPPFMLFGPAYKGIPLAAATAIKLAENHGLDVGYAFNRKEAKDHGEGGDLIGAELSGNVVIIDDVITAGTSVHQSVSAIRNANANPAAVVIALDRQEVADGKGLSAVQHVEQLYGTPVHAIVTLDDLITYLDNTDSMAEYRDATYRYRDQYGTQSFD